VGEKEEPDRGRVGPLGALERDASLPPGRIETLRPARIRLPAAIKSEEWAAAPASLRGRCPEKETNAKRTLHAH